jgi:hypothetical protein
LPFSVDASDLTLRPGFLAVLDAWAAEARARAAPRRTPVGQPWVFAGAREVTIDGPRGPLAVQRGEDGGRAVPPLLGAYRVRLGGAGATAKEELRVAAPVEREMDLRPRAAKSSADPSSLGERRASVDVSWAVALVLLGLLTLEMALRVHAQRTARA